MKAKPVLVTINNAQNGKLQQRKCGEEITKCLHGLLCVPMEHEVNGLLSLIPLTLNQTCKLRAVLKGSIWNCISSLTEFLFFDTFNNIELFSA